MFPISEGKISQRIPLVPVCPSQTFQLPSQSHSRSSSASFANSACPVRSAMFFWNMEHRNIGTSQCPTTRKSQSVRRKGRQEEVRCIAQRKGQHDIVELLPLASVRKCSVSWIEGSLKLGLRGESSLRHFAIAGKRDLFGKCLTECAVGLRLRLRKKREIGFVAQKEWKIKPDLPPHFHKALSLPERRIEDAQKRKKEEKERTRTKERVEAFFPRLSFGGGGQKRASLRKVICLLIGTQS